MAKVGEEIKRKEDESINTLEIRLKKWKEEKNVTRFDVGADIGGSSFRICFFDKKTSDEFVKVKCMCNSNDILGVFFEKIGEVVKRVFKDVFAEFTCLAVAGPVENPRQKSFIISNYIENARSVSLSVLPQNLVSKENSFIINDMESCCMGIIGLGEGNKLGKYFEKENYFIEGSTFKIAQQTKIWEKKSYFVVNMGTGLGSSVIRYSRRHGDYEVVPLELGHINMFFTKNKKDVKIYEEITKINKQKFGDEKECAPELEDIVSGEKGIGNLYMCQKRFYGNEDFFLPRFHPEDIMRIVKENMELTFYQIKKLFFVAQSMCTLFPEVSSVLFVGNNICQKRNKKILSSKKKELIECFKKPENHRVTWLDSKTGHIQIERVNFNLHGAIYYIKLEKDKIQKKE